MSEVKPVIKTWQEEAKEWPEDRRGLVTNQMIWMQQEIAELRAALEALQAENAKLKESAKYSEHIDATPANQRETMLYDTLVERDTLRTENAEQAKRIAEFVETIEDLGKISDICTKRYTKKVCTNCRCKESQKGAES